MKPQVNGASSTTGDFQEKERHPLRRTRTRGLIGSIARGTGWGWGHVPPDLSGGRAPRTRSAQEWGQGRGNLGCLRDPRVLAFNPSRFKQET